MKDIAPPKNINMEIIQLEQNKPYKYFGVNEANGIINKGK